MPCLVRFGVAIACGAIAPLTSARAQLIRGHVFLADSTHPAVGVVVTATSADSMMRVRALTSSSGAFALHVNSPGTYELRVLRIGYSPTIVPGVVVAKDSVAVQNIVLSSRPVTIAGMDVRDDGECSLKGSEGRTLLQLWEQARGALMATQLSEQRGALDFRVIRADGHIDAPQSFADSSYMELDTARARELILDRAFVAAPPETLAIRGFVTTTEEGRAVYRIPTAESLLSAAFINGHCFSIRSSSEHKDWIGIGFSPRRTAEQFVDIRGVL
jgi:hypothetical protein